MGAAESTEAKPVEQDGNETANTVENKIYPSALVICGPSGVGKGTLINRLMEGNDRFGFSCSHTTRQPRPGEQDGVHYYFTTKEQFEKEIAEGKFLEYAHVHSNIYGTSIRAVAEVAEQGKCCVLDIDVQGARQVRQAGLRAIFVFIAPPSLDSLENRLRGRGTETEEQVQKRLKGAAEEIASVQEPGLFDYVIVNDDLEAAASQLKSVGERALAGESGPPQGEQSVAQTATEEMDSELAPNATRTTEESEETGPPSQALSTHSDSATEEVLKPSYFRSLEMYKDKIVLVTGASSEVGATLCKAFALAGLKVVALAKARDGLQKLQKDLVLDSGVAAANFLPIVCDTTKEAEVVAVPRIVAKRWPDSGVDILINNEDVPVTDVSLLEGTAELWKGTILSCMLSICLCSREVIQDMQSRNSFGHIINIINDEETIGSSFQETLISTSKNGMKDLTTGLYKEVKAHGYPIPVCGIVYGAGFMDTSVSLADRVVQFKQTVKDLHSDILTAVGWCLMN